MIEKAVATPRSATGDTAAIEFELESLLASLGSRLADALPSIVGNVALVAERAAVESDLQDAYLRLLEDHERLARILESFEVGLILADAHWTVLFTNPEAGKLLGWGGHELAGRSVLDVLSIEEHDDDGGLHDFDPDACRVSLADGRLHRCESASFSRRDGARIPVFFTMNPVKTEPGGVVIVFRDLSAKLSSAQALREARIEAEAARRADRLKSEFLATMSHEMRTPMHAILSYAKFGQRSACAAPGDKLAGYFGKIRESGARLLDLLDTLLDLFRLESGAVALVPAPTCLATLIADVADEFRVMLAGRSLSLECVDSLRRRVVVDPTKIAQVVRNLLANSVRFATAGTQITIAVTREEDRARVSVADRGVGIPEAELELIFRKFAQSSRTATGAGGTGLGLAICREIVELHGGRIRARNRVGGGAEFSFDLPLDVAPERRECDTRAEHA